MGYLAIIEDLTKKRMKGLKSATAQEAFEAKKKIALKKIERDMADDTIRSNFDKFKKDAIQLAAEFTPEELALYVLTLTVQDPDSLPEVEIAREKPLPFKFAPGQAKGKGGRGGRDRDRGGRRDGDRNRDRGGRRGDRNDRNRRDDKFKRDNRRQDNKKPHQRTSSEKKTGFVIRNKGER
jgi:ATP-dependent RNA helicase DeaD